MSYKKIEQYGLIGNMRTAALVGTDGAIDWLCLPDFDSPAVFNAILDDQKGGSFQICPLASEDQRQIYLPDTNILLTRFGGLSSVCQVADFMPVRPQEESIDADMISVRAEQQVRLIRLVQGVIGRTRVRMTCRPAFNFALSPHKVFAVPGGVVFEASDGARLTLAIPCPFEINDGTVNAEFTVGPDDQLCFALEYTQEGVAGPTVVTPQEGGELMRQTARVWREWAGQCKYRGRWREQVTRSLLTLKLLTYSPTGAIVASPTTSLPEQIAGPRNWDYRYCWIRDSALTLEAFMRAGYVNEARRYMRWIGARAREEHEGTPLQIMYGIRGEHVLLERELHHLDGYRGSKPVRIGNEAHSQFQLDIYGELMEAVYVYNRDGWPISFDLWQSLCPILDWLAQNWQKPDTGIWEVRGGPRQFVHSNAMAWNALARGLKLAHERGFPANRDLWLKARDAIFLQLMERGWNEQIGSFVQSYGSDVVDASLLQMVNTGMLSPRDPKALSTISAIEKTLTYDSLVFRYDPSKAAPDGFGSDEGTFTMCTFWLVEAMARCGRLDDARFLFERMLGYASPLGLYSEETGPTGQMLGNFPQAFTHLSLVTSAFVLNRALDRGR